MQESPFYERVMERGIQQGMERGREQGIEQGIEQGTRQTTIENTLLVLTTRFPDADVNALKLELEAITDINHLKQVNLNALLASSFREFQQQLNT